ncbi:MAG TPA: hypothetical protein VGF08_07965 [Terriglobales bacterium]|jgi:hypothetical protein
MKNPGKRLLLLGFICLSSAMFATTLLQMNLQRLTGNAGKVFRGRVLSIDSGTVTAGGGQLPTVTYKILVEESFKGEFAGNEKQKVAVVTMVSNKMGNIRKGKFVRFSAFRDLPKLEIGKTYLLFTTQPSRIGLSTTVGLGQGAFRIAGKPGAETAVNEFNNAGLFRGMQAPAAAQAAPAARAAAAPSAAGSGPVAYSALAAQIRSIVGGK